MENEKLFVTLLLSLLLSTKASFCVQDFIRDDKRGVKYAYFVKNPSHRLNSAVLASFMFSMPLECAFQCINNQECYSVNFAVVSLDGRHACELLNADKFQNSSDLLHSESFDHYNIMVSVNLFCFK